MDIRTSLSELASEHVEASRVFQRHRLDFCCGGNRSLEDACKERGLDPERVLDEIRESGDPGIDAAWETRPTSEIIDHILIQYHEPLREELPRLLEMAERVEQKHVDNPDCPRGLASRLSHMIPEVESHLLKEEQILFPMIRAGQGTMADGPISVMEEEHDGHGENLRLVRSLAGDFQPPADACATWQALYRRLERLELDLMRHIHLENGVLFPKALAGGD